MVSALQSPAKAMRIKQARMIMSVSNLVVFASQSHQHFDRTTPMNRSRRWLAILIGAQFWALTASAIPTGTQGSPEKAVSHIPREWVVSSAIATVGYSKRLQVLEIEFLNGAIYRYLGVPRSAYYSLMAAPSKAHYYLEH